MHSLRLTGPRLRVVLGVGERHLQLERVEVDARVAFLKDHLVTMRIPEIVDPGSFVVSGRIDNQRVAFPAAGGVTPPSRQVDILRLRKLPAVGPDGSETISPLEMLIN